MIVVGASVTSNDAGLSVPDWPTSFGHSPVSYKYFQVPLVGGVLYEHGHRILAEFTGILTIVLAAWIWRTDRRSWMRRLGLAALGIVILQGVLGGVSVLRGIAGDVTYRMLLATAHAAMGQAFFCIAVAVALFTGRRWVGEEPHTHFDTRRPSLPTLAWLSVAIVYLQLILGGMFRHNGIRLLPHVICAVAVCVLLIWTVLRTLSQFGEREQLRRPAVTLLVLLILQLALGFAAYLTRVVWIQGAAVAGSTLVLSTVAHVSVGALLLATAVVLAIQAVRHVPVLHDQRVPGAQKAVTA